MAISDNFIASFQNTNSLEKPTKRLWVVIFQIKLEAVWDINTEKLKKRKLELQYTSLLMITFYVVVSARLSGKW